MNNNTSSPRPCLMFFPFIPNKSKICNEKEPLGLTTQLKINCKEKPSL